MNTSNTIAQTGEYQPVRSISKVNTQLLLNAALVAIALAVYWPVLSGQFQVQWDDQLIVINGYTGGGLKPANLWAILTEFYVGQYAPVTQLSYSAIYAAVGYNPFWFHLLGVTLHVANVLLIYSFIKKLLTQAKATDEKAINRIAFITALLMAVHPFLVEAVGWISASKVLVYSFFYLLAVNVYLKYLQNKSLKYYLLVVVLFALSFGGKEQAVTLPVCLLLIDYAVNRNLKDKKVWLEKLPLFLLALVFGYITLLSQKADNNGLLTDIPKYPFYQNIIFACYSLTEYAVKCLIPVKLSHLYLFPNGIGDPVPMRFWIYPVVVFIVAIAFLDFWRKKWVFFATGFFIIHLAVALHIIPISRFAIIADRYIYIASIGFFFLLAWFFNYLLINSKTKNLALTLGLFYLLGLGLYAHSYSKVWYDSTTLKKDLMKGLLEQRNNLIKQKAIKK